MSADTSKARPWAQRTASWDPLILAVLAVVALVVAGQFGAPPFQRSVTLIMVNLVLVLSLYVFIGLSGVLSFGHAGFMAIGAYTSALLTMRPQAKAALLPDLPQVLAHAHVPIVVGILGAAAVAGAIGFAVGIPLMRLNGIAAAIATFAVLMIVAIVIRNWDTVTGGAGTMTGVPLRTGLWSAALWALVAAAVVFLVHRSRLGLRLRAAREDGIAAASMGVAIWRSRLFTFTISAAIAGAGGALFGHFLGAFSPDTFFLRITFLTFAMLVVGGLTTMTGAMLGTVVVGGATEFLRILQEGITVGGVTVSTPIGLRDILLAVVVLVIMLLRPQGLTSGRELRLLGCWTGGGDESMGAADEPSHERMAALIRQWGALSGGQRPSERGPAPHAPDTGELTTRSSDAQPID